MCYNDSKVDYIQLYAITVVKCSFSYFLMEEGAHERKVLRAVKDLMWLWGLLWMMAQRPKKT